MRFALVDISNLFHRARHSTMMAAPEDRVGLALLLIFRSLRKMHREWQADHIVFAADHGSWRYAEYPAYKSRRRLERLELTPRLQEEHRQSMEILDGLLDYLGSNTRCTLLRASDIEGDDFIARWIARHQDDDHVIMSADSDFVQLLAENVRLYDALNQRTLSVEGVTDIQGKRLAFTVSPKDGHVVAGEVDENFIVEPQWWRKALFIKLIRGDSSDSVFSAYPGVRYNGKKCSIRAAWDDRVDQGYDWNNLMFQTWEKLVEGETRRVRVIDEYRINERLIDLTKQPPAIVEKMDSAIDAAVSRPSPHQIGAYFLRFCQTYNLPTLAKEATDHVAYLNASYRH